MVVADENNRAARLIDERNYAEAERALDGIEAELTTRPVLVVDGKHLQPALDEYFYRVHRIMIAWAHERYEVALTHAERAWQLEQDIMAAARKANVADVSVVAFSAGAWGLISVLTRVKQLEAAARYFSAATSDESWFWARHRRDAAAAEKLLIACLWIYFQNKDPAWLAKGRKLVKRACALIKATTPELPYGYACYYALLAEKQDIEIAFEQLARALELGIDPETLLADDDLLSLHDDPRWQQLVRDKIFTLKVATVPPHAAVLFDGVEVGVTPYAMRPPSPGKHTIQFVLADHEPTPVIDLDKLEHLMKQPLGLNINLISNAARAAEKTWRAAREPLAISTREFIGDQRAAGAILVRDTTYGLGGLSIRIAGTGDVEMRKSPWGEREREILYRFTLPAADVDRVFELFCTESFTQLEIPPHTGVPDEISYTVQLFGAGGQARNVSAFTGAFGGSPEGERLDRIIQGVGAILRPHLSAAKAKELTF